MTAMKVETEAENLDGLNKKNELLTAPIVCGWLKISRTKFYELISGDSPKLKSVRIGKSRRILSRDLDAYVDSLVG